MYVPDKGHAELIEGGPAAQAARQAFTDGLSAGSLVAAAGTAAAAAAAAAFLPARAKAPRPGQPGRLRGRSAA